MPNTMLEKGTLVTTHPTYRGERSQRGVVAKPGPMLSKVQIGGELLTFWNFELEPLPSLHA